MDRRGEGPRRAWGKGSDVNCLLGTDQLKASPALLSLLRCSFPLRVPELPSPPPAGELDLGGCLANFILPSLAT